jgi:hypothetical protein
MSSVCSVGFSRKGFGGGITARSPLKEEAARALGAEPWPHVLVDATIMAR